MTKAQQEINFQIADNLKDYNKEFEFKYDDDSCSFNVLDGKRTGKGYRHIRHYNEEDEKVPLGGVEPEEALSTEVSAANFNGDGYIFLTSNPIDIPLLHAWGVSYLATCNDAIISDYVQELENSINNLNTILFAGYKIVSDKLTKVAGNVRILDHYH